MSPEIQPMTIPNFAAIDAHKQNRELTSNAAAMALSNQQETQRQTGRKERIEAYDYALNVIGSVSSEEDMMIAKKLLHTKYPETADGIEAMLPNYDPNRIEVIRKSLRTETQRLKSEEINAYSPGSALYRGDKKIGEVPVSDKGGDYELFDGPSGDQIYVKKGGPVPPGYSKNEKDAKPDYEVFEGPKGEQKYVKKGDPIPDGFKKVVTKGTNVTVQTGNADLTKPTKTKLEGEIIEGLQNIKSFNDTKALFKPEFLTLFGKGDAIVANAVDKAGMSSDKQKKLIQDRAKWFRQAKADFIAFRKWATGVAGGEQELKELATAFPDPVNNSPTQYIANLNSIEETTKKVLALNADFLRTGISLDQPLSVIIEQAKAKGISVPGAGGSGGTVTIIKYDNQGNRIK